MKTTLLTAVFVLAIAVSSAAAQGRGGARGVGNGGHWGVHGPGQVAATRGRLEGRPLRFREPRGRIVIGGGIVDPLFWRPYPYWGYPFYYDAVPYAYNSTGSLKTDVFPKETAIFIDGYYAGTARDFDGAFTRLHTAPGNHTITLELPGYRTVSENIYVPPDFTYTLRETMQPMPHAD